MKGDSGESGGPPSQGPINESARETLEHCGCEEVKAAARTDIIRVAHALQNVSLLVPMLHLLL